MDKIRRLIDAPVGSPSQQRCGLCRQGSPCYPVTPMIVSHELKLIFIGIPRTGTLTVRQILDPYTAHPLLPQHQNFSLPMGHAERVDHATARELRAHLGEQVWRDYFKFTIVRNPWDRVASWFNCDYFRRQGIGFEDWLVGGGLGNPDYSINHIAPAALWLLDEQGRLAVDFVGRYETYRQDLLYALERVGIRLQDIPHLNASRKSDYRDLYNARTRDIVANYYAEDIARFGYSY